MAIDDLVNGSDAIVIGNITGVTQAWNPERTHIVTTATIEIGEILKGDPVRPVTIMTLGGTVDNTTEWSEDMPVLADGEYAGIFLSGPTDGIYTVYGHSRGIFPLEPGPVTRAGEKSSRLSLTPDEFREMIGGGMTAFSESMALQAVKEASGAPVITGVSPVSASAGTGSVVTITGTGFGTKASPCSYADVGFFYYESLFGHLDVFASGYPYCGEEPYDIISWTDTRIQVRVPANRFTGGPYNLTPSSGFVEIWTDGAARSNRYPFAVTFGYGSERWESGPTFFVNPTGCPGLAASAENMAGAWNSRISSSGFQFTYGGTSSKRETARDGTNLIYFGETDALASTRYWLEDGKIVEADTVISWDEAWTTGTGSGGTYNLDSVVLHEIGHWVSLNDLYGDLAGYPQDYYPESKVMFGYRDDMYGNMNLKTLGASDIAGIRYAYPAAPPVPAAVSPAIGQQGQSYRCTITGSNFQQGASVYLTRTGAATIGLSGVSVVSTGTITGNLTVPATAQTGSYLVTVIQSSGTGSGPAAFLIGGAPLAADFSGTPRTGTSPLAVSFTDQSTGNPSAWNWNFGDGTANATEKNPVHVFTARGNHTVTLTVTGQGGSDSERKLEYIQVSGGSCQPVIAFPGKTTAPTDLDGDCLYEDTNGNGRKDFNDVITFFNNITWIPQNEPVAAFDFNGNGRIDFNDLILLFNEVSTV